jgi:hypothetical protein
VPEEPPEPGGAARGAVVVCHHEDAVRDPRPPRRSREGILPRQRVAALALDRQVGELDAEERRAGDVGLEVEVAPGLPAVELVCAVDEAVVDQ